MMKVGLAQLNPVVGDLDGNARKIAAAIDAAKVQGCQLVVFPELVLTGYPPEDLLLKPSFIAANKKTLSFLAKSTRGIAAVIGFVDEQKGKKYNAAAWIEKGRIRTIYHKRTLPNYGVFDEVRYFSPGQKPAVVSFEGYKIGLTICEDVWEGPQQIKELKNARPDIVVNLSASPFHADKIQQRTKVVGSTAKTLKSPILYTNMVGGQDELVFDGGSFAVDAIGKTKVQFPLFEENIFLLTLNKKGKSVTLAGPSTPALKRIDQIHSALVLGLRDYIQKNGFQKVLIGLSGGIDSALVAALAVDAVGASNVIGVTLPSRYNTAETKNDAQTLAQNLGLAFRTIPIEPVYESLLKTLAPHFEGTAAGLAEENLQARIRGNILMALSNKFGWLVLTTGNKSEMSTGYCTLYGDTAGGFAVLKDVLKTTVYELSNRINQKAERELIPLSIIQRPPTAELRDNQKDEDSLGPYAQLDPVIVGYVENNLPFHKLRTLTPASEAHIQKILSLIDRSEYKRRQAPPGIKITPRAFGRDHRMPLTNRSNFR